jgi:hypothetical protein
MPSARCRGVVEIEWCVSSTLPHQYTFYFNGRDWPSSSVAISATTTVVVVLILVLVAVILMFVVAILVLFAVLTVVIVSVLVAAAEAVEEVGQHSLGPDSCVTSYPVVTVGVSSGRDKEERFDNEIPIAIPGGILRFVHEAEDRSTERLAACFIRTNEALGREILDQVFEFIEVTAYLVLVDPWAEGVNLDSGA